jgi:transcriptional regulator with XRE-family HTH domain
MHMAKRELVVSPVARDVLLVLGQRIKVARIERGWTMADVASRSLTSTPTIRNIEAGAPGTAIGTVFQVAYLLGVPLFGIEDPAEIARLRRQGEDTLALLPSRVRSREVELDDDF